MKEVLRFIVVSFCLCLMTMVTALPAAADELQPGQPAKPDEKQVVTQPAPKEEPSKNAGRTDQQDVTKNTPTPIVQQPEQKEEKIDRRPKFQTSIDFVISSKYKDLISDIYKEASLNGGGGWLGVDLGAKWNINNQLSISPSVGILFNYIEFKKEYPELHYSETAKTYINYIILPKVTARYQFFKTSSPYVGVEVNYNKPHTEIEDVDFKSGSLGYGVFIGYTPNGKALFELGYQYIPIEVTGYKTDNYGGGATFRIVGTF